MILEIKNLYKKYDSNQVLDCVNFKIDKPEIVSIVGKSGVGKSTLLKIIASLETFNEGEVLINDIPITTQTNKSVGFVFQNFNLFPHLTVKKNIELSPKYVFKFSKEKINNKTNNLLSLLDIKEKEMEYPSNLSGGEQQRVAIARALATNPSLILFDEPTSALDVTSTKGLINTMNELRKTNIAMIVVTHDLAFAKEISDRIVLVEKGKIVFDSSQKKEYDSSMEILDSLYKS